MLHAIWNVSGQEPSVVISQVVVDCIAAGDRTIGVQRVDVIVGGANTQLCLQQTGSHEHQGRRNNQLTWASRNQQTAFVFVGCNVDNRLLERSFVQVGISARTVGVGATSHSGVQSVEQGHAIARLERGKTGVQQRRCFDLLGVSHGASQSFGVAGRQRVIQVIFHRFFSDGETHSNRLVRITRGERFLSVVIGDRRAFGFHRSSTKAGELHFFFERAFGSFGLIDLSVLVFILGILKTEQGVKTR